MAVYIGVDFHPYEQTLAFVDEADGEIRYKRFLHSDKAGIKAFLPQVRKGRGYWNGGHGIAVVV
ncbi:MAG: hypothetical protein IPN51_08920 [Chloracidobacterium sp.]|nr:hypothetical protein [Chloracidobacterium sp.]